MDTDVPSGVQLPPRIDPWQHKAHLTTPIELWARTMRLAATLGEPSFRNGQLALHPVADFYLHNNGWKREEAEHGVLWQGPDHLPPVWRVGRRQGEGWILDPSLWQGNGQDAQWSDGQRALVERLDQLRLVEERGACLKGSVLPWWLLPGLEPLDGPSVQGALERVHTAADAFTIHILQHTGPVWWRLSPPSARDGSPRWNTIPCRLAASADGRSFSDPGDRVQAGAVAGPVLARLWSEGNPQAIDRLTLPGCATQANLVWAWELCEPRTASAHSWMTKTGVWRAVAKRLGQHAITYTGAPSSGGTDDMETIEPGTGGRASPIGGIERNLAMEVREGGITADHGRLILKRPLACDHHWTTPEGVCVWGWPRGNGTGCIGLVGWPAHPNTTGWYLHPDLFALPSNGAILPKQALEAQVAAMDVVVERGKLRRGGVLPWWALGAEEPHLDGPAGLFWEQVQLAIQAFLTQHNAEHACVVLCPPQHKKDRLEWAKPMLRLEGTIHVGLADPFQRILLPLVERAFAQPTCRFLPGHAARAVWRMVGDPTPFPAQVAHPGPNPSAHHRLAMAAAWTDLMGEG